MSFIPYLALMFVWGSLCTTVMLCRMFGNPSRKMGRCHIDEFDAYNRRTMQIFLILALCSLLISMWAFRAVHV